nr:hypothetical protein [Tanacetum cinerariifolium]
VANAARNYEILHERDDEDTERQDKRQRSGDRHQPTSQQSSHRSHGHHSDRHGSDRRGGSDNHCSSNNNYSGSNNRNSGNGRDQRNRGHQSNRSANSGSQQSRGPSEGYSYPVCTTCGRRHQGECRRATGTCFKCGQAGHLQKDCKKNTTTSTSGQADKKPGALGRIFAITEGQAANTSEFKKLFFLQFFPRAEKERLKKEYHSIRQTNTETSTEFMQHFLRLAGFLGAAAGTEDKQAKNFQWGLRRSTLNHLMCMSYTDVAQVANAARNYEILHERDDDDAERPDKRNDRHGSDRRGGGDNHRSNNNYSSNKNRNSDNGRDQRNRGQQFNRSANSGSQQSRGPSEGYSYPIISALQASTLLSHGCERFLATIHDTTSDVPSIHDQPIVSEFPDVFPDELPGIPL